MRAQGLISSQLQRSDRQARAMQTWSYIWSQANISSLITSNHGVAYTHEQKSRAWSRASMELHLITSKHPQFGHAQAWSCIWSRANTSMDQLDHMQTWSFIWSRANLCVYSMITSRHEVSFDHEKISPAWSQTNMTNMELHLSHRWYRSRKNISCGLPQANRLQLCHA